jgi:hypothetical protein
MAPVLARAAAALFVLLACAGCVFDPPAATERDAGAGTELDAKIDPDASPGDGSDSGVLDLGSNAGDSEPLDVGPGDAPAMDADPMDADPMDAAPVDADPMDAAPMDAAPMDAEPMDAEPLDTGPADTGVFNGFSYVPRNFDPLVLTPGAASTLDCDARISALATPTITEWCGQPLPSITTRPDGSHVLAMESLTVGIGASITIQGHRPIIFAVFGDATISGEIRSDDNVNFSGSGSSCPPAGSGGTGTDDSGGAGGGGGGAFAEVGGPGGDGSGNNGGSMGMMSPVLALEPLRGGCHGGEGGRDSGNRGGVFGAGGGGLQISAAGELFVDSLISANGGGGQGGTDGSGGGGGGSGGGILLEGRDVTLTNFTWITANGGGGGEGGAGGTGDPGDDGIPASTDRAPGGSGAGSGGDGGRGGAGIDLAGETGFTGTGMGGGGGGGGSAGVIIVDNMGGMCMSMSASFSPAPQGSCP